MSNQERAVAIGTHLVGPGQPVFIVAEIGINHNGYVEIAKKLIDVAISAGANAVKFQTRTVDEVYTPEELQKPRQVPRQVLENALERGVLSDEAEQRLRNSDFKDSTNGDLKNALEFTLEEYSKINAYCENRCMLWFTSCWDATSARQLVNYFDLPCHKVASACNEDDELMEVLRSTGKPVILSTGMTALEGVREAVSVLGTDDLIILHCTSVYPTGLEAGDEILRHINLRGMQTLREEFPGVPVGFSSHDSGIMPSYAAAAMGAVMLEKHVTLERGMFGSDQPASSEPLEFGNLCRMTRELFIARGDGQIVVYPEEHDVEQKLRRVRRICPAT